MKTLIVYYSLDGATARVADALKTVVSAAVDTDGAAVAVDVLRLELAKTPKLKGALKIAWGVAQGAAKNPPALKPYDVNVAAYDTIIVGTPVWAGGPAPAVKAFLAEHRFNEKKVAFFACHAGGPGKVFDALTAAVNPTPDHRANTVIGTLDCNKAATLGEPELAQKCAAWWSTVT
jgi:flavodoxin